MFSITLQRAQHVRQYSVTPEGAGWELTLQEDQQLTRQTRYQDWHRVERAVARVRREVADLAAQGWEVKSTSP